MSGPLTLTVTTPLTVPVRAIEVTSVRAEDGSGGFGIQPGHADFLTVLGASVLRWRDADGPWRFCALRGGVLRVSGGTRVDVACREAVAGDDLARLETLIRAQAEDEGDAARRARGEQTRLHASAIRRLMLRLGPQQPGVQDLAEDFQ
ncbi:F0F1 ATP synthase subunit epsilon [Actibacterium sp. D379-3]